MKESAPAQLGAALNLVIVCLLPEYFLRLFASTSLDFSATPRRFRVRLFAQMPPAAYLLTRSSRNTERYRDSSGRSRAPRGCLPLHRRRLFAISSTLQANLSPAACPSAPPVAAQSQSAARNIHCKHGSSPPWPH